MYTIEDKTKLIHDFKQYSDKEDSYCSYSYEGVEAIYGYIEDQQYEYEDYDLEMFKFWSGLTYTDIRIIFNETDLKDIDDLGYDDDSRSELKEFLKENYDSEILNNGDHVIKVYDSEFKGFTNVSSGLEIIKTLKSIITVNLDNH